MSTINKKFIENVIEMVKLYDEVLITQMDISPSEFAKSNFCEKKLFINQMKEGCFAVFFDICSLRSFLKVLCEEGAWPRDPKGMVHMYLLLFCMTPINRNIILESILKYFKPRAREKMVKFLSQGEIFNLIEKRASEVCTDLKMKDYILKEVKERASMITHLRAMLERTRRHKKLQSINFSIEQGYRILNDFNSPGDNITITIPYKADQSPEFLRTSNSSNSPEENTTITVMPEKDNQSMAPVGDSISYKSTSKCQKSSRRKTPTPSMQSCFDISAKLCSANIKTSEENEIEKFPEIVENLNLQQVPQIKQTITQVLREGARVKKKAEQAERVFKDLCKGSTDPNKIQALLDEIRQEENETELREIERKHLLGRISQEEARLAKLALQKSNQAKAAELKKQRQELELKLADYRKIEEARMKELAEKNHAALELTRQAQANLLDQKKRTAKEIQEESRQMHALIYQRKQEELNYKISLIRQIKELEHASKLSLNKDTCSKSSHSIGASYSMNLEELKEALIKLKAAVQEEVNIRKDKIQKEKLRQQELIQNVKETIERYKNVSKKPTKAKSIKEIKLTPEIIQLRRKLKQRKAEAARMETSS